MENVNNIDEMIEKNLILFKKNVKYLRKEANRKTLGDVAEEVDVSRDSLFKLENDKDRSPNFKTVLKFYYYFGVSLDDLINKDLELEEMKRVSSLKYEKADDS